MTVDTARGRFELVDEGSGTAVVLVHGFPFDASAWRDDARALASEMRIVAPSMRGFGGTPLADPPSITIDGMADDVAAILDALGLTAPIVIGGLSMGGYVALAFARRFPHRVRALVLADTRADADTDEARANRDAGIEKVRGGDLAGFVDGLVPKILSEKTRIDRPEVFARIRGLMMTASPAAVVEMLRALRDRPDARPSLSTISQRALVLVGEHDALMPPAIAQVLRDGLRNAELRTIPEAGHISNLENPAAFRAELSAFVRSINAPAP
jgi:3-oxoadipate enol-lactonase